MSTENLEVVEVVVSSCHEDPCSKLANAVAGSCQSQGEADFSCGCHETFIWIDDSNSCSMSK